MAATLCILILAGFAVAGLWPFHQIANQITWLPNSQGVAFGKHGIVLSTGSLPYNKSGACSIEMWVRPAGSGDSGALLAFYGPDDNKGLSLHRSIKKLSVSRETGGRRPLRQYVDNVLRDGELVFLTIVSGNRGASVYLNGSPSREFPDLRSASGDCSGSFGVGHSARGHSSWQGEVRGVAIYHRELAPEQVLAGYRSWKATGLPSELAGGKPDAAYLFNEKSGKTIRDHGASGVNLTIPDQYGSVQPTLLQSPWKAFEGDWDYFEDFLVNIGGFMPFGFALRALLLSMGRISRPLLFAVVGGFIVSLTIETLQFFLPTRSSDITDVLTNTLGACLGAMVFAAWQRRLTQTL